MRPYGVDGRHKASHDRFSVIMRIAGERVGFLPNTEVDGEVVRIVKAKAAAGGPGRGIVMHLRGRGDVALTTDAMIAMTRGD